MHGYSVFVEEILYGNTYALLKYNIKNDGWELSLCLHRASGIWKSVKGTVDDFSSCIQYKSYDANRIHFWTGIWCVQSSFNVHIPLLYSIACNKSSCVTIIIILMTSRYHVPPLGAMSDVEIQSYGDLMRLLEGYSASPTRKDDRI